MTMRFRLDIDHHATHVGYMAYHCPDCLDRYDY